MADLLEVPRKSSSYRVRVFARRQHRCGTLFWLARLVELPASHPKKHLCGGFEERRSFAGRAAKRRRENSGREERCGRGQGQGGGPEESGREGERRRKEKRRAR